MKVTKRQIADFFNASEKYLNLNSGEINRLIYALTKVRKKLKSVYETYLDDIMEIKIDLASVNEKGNVIVSNNQYDFTPAKLKEMNKKIKDKSLEQIEIEPHFVSKNDVPLDMEFAFRELFIDFVIENEE